MSAVDVPHNPRRLLPASLIAGVLVGASSLLAAQPAAAQWKWVTPAGVVQYSDQPPPANVPLKNILARPLAAPARGPVAAASMASSAAPASAPGNAAQTQAARELQQKLEQDKRAKEAAQRLQQQVDAQARQSNCLQAQRQLQTLDSGVRLAEIDAQGNRAFLTDAQRTAQRQQAAAAIAAYCR